MRTAIVAFSTLAVALAATCGQTPIKPDLTHVNTKIVGGWLSDKICSLECGGSVVAPGWVVTAGHCVYDDLNAKNYRVKAGVFDEAKSDEDAEQVVDVKAIYLHPDYNARQTHHDIALIELATPITFGDHVQPVCLPLTDDVALTYPGDLWVTGWGTTREQGAISRQLRQADVPIVDLPTCEKEYPRKIVEEVEFCAGKQGVDSCQGDSGGPVQSRGPSGNWYQYGIVSWGKGCAEKGEAGVYSRVSAYCPWIKTTTNSTVQCQDVL
ncbi:hypothetical protein PENTCL1PPCAC_22022 [Pristionchus entomophagus]|uniref:limulus clotting factor C n=1 Tax=Pristionchus entomophagus TaxID=358040 RepID=A0AAV5U066_9BILA|nr:hypothetical protein PENTCL1PPCAC_22022 [Pristionchus entomophagus]